ncbi:MAG: YqaE/Pmp3 family membrane protein [Terriglobus roseus]|nr:YqaE/Pmp3 family membrane protein [Terriglobus roseus]
MPPVGVFLVAGCGADLLINICLTILGYFPGVRIQSPLLAVSSTDARTAHPRLLSRVRVLQAQGGERERRLRQLARAGRVQQQRPDGREGLWHDCSAHGPATPSERLGWVPNALPMR